VQVALAALAVGHAFGMHISEMLTGLQDPETQVRLLLAPGPHDSELIDDTYNASTPSVLSALALLEEIPARRRIAVLGDMRELGSISDDEHRVVGRRASDIVDVLLTYGEMAQVIADEAIEARGHTPKLVVQSFREGDKDEVVAWLRAELRTGDVVLFKGSRGLAMESMVKDLRVDVEEPKSARAGHGEVVAS
jgi:UDP-N-acetylmuramoyl-tripeptide--D-alanyl-D-alanine ligase